MAFGRIKRGRAKSTSGYRKGPGITTAVARNGGETHKGYSARACIGKIPGNFRAGARRCSYALARTPQSALAKAVKALSHKIAKRNGRS